MEDNYSWGITPAEKASAMLCMEKAMGDGASACRLTLNKSLANMVSILDGQVDKIASSADKSLTVNLFADGRYGTFSTNDLSPDGIGCFVSRAIDIVRNIAPDGCRRLPGRERICTTARTGLELGLCDGAFPSVSPQKRIEMARISAEGAFSSLPAGLKPLSSETAYTDSVSDCLVLDSEGLECRHIETSYETDSETTLLTPSGERVSGTWWDAAPKLEDFRYEGCAAKASARAAAMASPGTLEGGRYRMVVENDVASRLLTPVLAALGGFAIQQKNSFLKDALGRKVFPEGLYVEDSPLEHGRPGSRLFDSEGTASSRAGIISGGVVERFFINTYISAKTGLPPTIEDAIRPAVAPFLGGRCRERVSLEEILDACHDGIYVTGFNGGNCNSATGDFSYGVEGFAIRNGKIDFPVREMLITGNMISLWNNLLAAGSDWRPCSVRRIGTLAFDGVSFSS